MRGLSAEWISRAELPSHVVTLLNNLPSNVHPMTQFTLNSESKFAAYEQGGHKSKYWEATFEDSMDLIAKLPIVAATIYNNLFREGAVPCPPDPPVDWSANFCEMIGYKDPVFTELMRFYLTIHSDHEGGNVPAHATHLVGSALSDPYLSFTAGMCGLAGPLHGLANQEVLVFLEGMVKEVSMDWTDDATKAFIWGPLKSGRVVPVEDLLPPPPPSMELLLLQRAGRHLVLPPPHTEGALDGLQHAPCTMRWFKSTHVMPPVANHSPKEKPKTCHIIYLR